MEQQVSVSHFSFLDKLRDSNTFTLLIAGIGKTFYIKKQLANCHSVIVAVNESFKPLKAIQRLNVLPKTEQDCAIFFNFNLIPPSGVSERLYWKPVFAYF